MNDVIGSVQISSGGRLRNALSIAEEMSFYFFWAVDAFHNHAMTKYDLLFL